MSYNNPPRYHNPIPPSPGPLVKGSKPVKIDFHPWHPEWDVQYKEVPNGK